MSSWFTDKHQWRQKCQNILNLQCTRQTHTCVHDFTLHTGQISVILSRQCSSFKPTCTHLCAETRCFKNTLFIQGSNMTGFVRVFWEPFVCRGLFLTKKIRNDIVVNGPENRLQFLEIFFALPVFYSMVKNKPESVTVTLYPFSSCKI